MKINQTLSSITPGPLLGLEDVLKELQSDIVFVHGDTTTTFVGAITPFYQQIDIDYVQDGLRT